MATGPTSITLTFDSVSHDLVVNATQNFDTAPSMPLPTVKLAGNQYDMLAGILAQYIRPDRWVATNTPAAGTDMPTPSAISTYITDNPSATTPDVMAWIVTETGTLGAAFGEKDVARMLAAFFNILNAPPGPGVSNTIENETAPSLTF